MVRIKEIQIDVSPLSSYLNVSFERRTERTIFDICDINGRIRKSGVMEDDCIQISVTELENSHYVLLVLDGDRVYSQKFCICR